MASRQTPKTAQNESVKLKQNATTGGNSEVLVSHTTVCHGLQHLSSNQQQKQIHSAKPMTLKPEISLTNTRTDFSLYLKLHYLWQESGLNNMTGPPKNYLQENGKYTVSYKILSYHLQLLNHHFYSAVSTNVAYPQHIKPPQARTAKEYIKYKSCIENN